MPFVYWLLKCVILYLAQLSVAVQEGNGSVETEWARTPATHLITDTFNVNEWHSHPAPRGRWHGREQSWGQCYGSSHSLLRRERAQSQKRTGWPGQCGCGAVGCPHLTARSPRWCCGGHCCCHQLPSSTATRPQWTLTLSLIGVGREGLILIGSRCCGDWWLGVTVWAVPALLEGSPQAGGGSCVRLQVRGESWGDPWRVTTVSVVPAPCDTTTQALIPLLWWFYFMSVSLCCTKCLSALVLVVCLTWWCQQKYMLCSDFYFWD